jgi:hypothetical protein
MTAINVPTLRAAALLEKEKNTAARTARTPERWRSRHAVADTAAARSKTFLRAATQPLVSDRKSAMADCPIFSAAWNQGCNDI